MNSSRGREKAEKAGGAVTVRGPERVQSYKEGETRQHGN